MARKKRITRKKTGRNPVATTKRPLGRPRTYRPEYAAQAEKLCKLHATDTDIASFFEVDVRTYYRWRRDYPDFCQSVTRGKAQANACVAASLFRRATGYSQDAVKIVTVEGEIRRVPYVEHFPPDTTAAIFWLKNRDRENWRDTRELAGPDGGDIPVKMAVDSTELARQIAFVLRGGKDAGKGTSKAGK